MLDRLPVAGGMMFAGYPNFRLPVAVLNRENAPAAWGVETRFGVTVDAALVDRLATEFDAVFLGIGKFKEVRLGIPGEELDGVWDALDLLTRVKLAQSGLGEAPRIGQRVIVLGAGYTAQDASRTLRRMGREVTILYRRAKEQMPVHAALRERHVARQSAEGAPYVFETTAVRVLGEQGRVTALECVRTQPGPPDASGRPEALPVAGSNVRLPCDAVVEATGEVVDLSYLPADLRLKDEQHVWVDPETWMTSRPGLFAAGEMTGLNGTDRAFASGLAAATAIDRYLQRDPERRGEEAGVRAG